MIHQCLGSSRQALLRPAQGLSLNRPLKRPTVCSRSRQVIKTDTEGSTTDKAVPPLQRLRFDLNPLEFSLLLRGSAIGAIPITEILQLTTLLSRQTPVCQFMQGATEITVSKDNAVRLLVHLAWQINGFTSNSHQLSAPMSDQPGVQSIQQFGHAGLPLRFGQALNHAKGQR